MKEEALRNELRRTQDARQPGSERDGGFRQSARWNSNANDGRSVEAMNEEMRETMRRIELAALGSDGTPAWTAAQQMSAAA